MAFTRQRESWCLSAIMTANLLNCWAKEPIDPRKLIPRMYWPPESKKSQAEIEAESVDGWRIINHWLRGFGEKRGKKNGGTQQ